MLPAVEDPGDGLVRGMLPVNAGGGSSFRLLAELLGMVSEGVCKVIVIVVQSLVEGAIESRLLSVIPLL
jgi:hypothetical protein